jgi:HK97 family phage major capsid protein
MDAADLKLVKESIETLGRAWEEYKPTLKAIKEGTYKGQATDELQTKLNKLDAALTDAQAVKGRLEAIETALNRTGGGNGGAAPIMVKDCYGGEWEQPADHKAFRNRFAKFIRKGEEGVTTEGRQVWTPSDADRKSLSVQSDPDGGYTVIADMSGRVIRRVFETSPLRALASVQNISSDALEGLYDDNEASAGWVSEAGTRSSSSTPQIGKWRIPVHEMYAMPAATQRILDDSNINIEQWLAQKVADYFARFQNTSFVTGTGIGKPRGFLTYTAGTTLRTTVQQVASGTSAVFTYAGLVSLVYALKADYRQRASFGMNRTSISAVRKIVDGQQRPLWEPSLQVGEPMRLLGYAVNELNDMPDPAASSLSAAFADWKEFYQIVDRQGLRILRDPYTSKGFVLFYTTARVGGDVLNTEAGKIQVLST